MTPTEQGRHCAVCSKVVVDFSQKTDAELLLWLSHSGREGTCGRFRADQLARPLQASNNQAVASWRRWFAAAAALWVWRVAAPALGQAKSLLPRQAAARLTPRMPALLHPDGLASVAGEVCSASTGQPLTHATVWLSGTAIRTTTDAHGRFQLALPASRPADEAAWQVRVSLPGYVTEQMPAALVSYHPILLAHPTADSSLPGILGGAVLSGVPIRNAEAPHPPRLQLEDWLR
ncbi:hypothetical protein B0919_02215 [Hymenobacter sp. CRA2]|nr:hypothetical protein B0919_02215 [Hymenobacter sp. CRA2]